MRNVVVVHYDELALKSGNRGAFERQLVGSIESALSDLGRMSVARRHGRVVVSSKGEDVPGAAIAARLRTLPGIRYVLEAVETDATMEAIEAALARHLPAAPSATFGVRARRADKAFPLSSPEVESAIGAAVLALRPGWTVRLTKPDHWIKIEIVDRRALVGTVRHQGPGGLPIGSSGHGVALVSGGIDSPVAARQLMVRGLKLDLVHFHSAPYTDRASQEKVREITRILTGYQPRIDLHLVPFADPIQQAIVAVAPPRYRVLLYRRFMMRLAARIGACVGAACVATGESLGQVASQTLDNIAAVQAACPCLVIRPLIGMNKSAIIDIAQAIGTFEISTRPHQDCCSLFMPRRPATRARAEELEDLEASLDVEELCARTLAGAVHECYTRAGSASGPSAG